MKVSAITLFVCALLAASCSSGGDTVTQVADGDVDGRGGDVTAPEVRAPDSGADLAVDSRSPDRVSDGGPDTPFVECEPGSGCFLDSCAGNSDCQSGWCVEHMGAGVCTQLCSEECPPGWSCKQVGSDGPDVTWVCVSSVANLCRPCATTADCKSVGGAEDLCLDYGDDGSFCGGVCAEDDDCPWGFLCSDAITVDGVETKQCVSETGGCPCTEKSVSLSLWTPCVRSNEFGSCAGKRVCTEEGLTECDAAEPAAEVCDGADNDCDGDVDEPAEVGGDYVNLCDDDNACTVDTCAGAGGCQNEALDEGECMDGNPCTVADHCVGGVCVGDPVQCDDENPCTDNICTEEGGCEYPPNTAACDDGDACTVGDTCDEGECVGIAVPCECQVDADCAGLEDGDLCNGTLVCDIVAWPHKCVVDEATVVLCPEPADPCLGALCDPESGSCGEGPVNDGFLCDDGDPCTVAEACDQGLCTGGMAVNCDDGKQCTADSCDPAGGCVHVPAEGPCNDGNGCTEGDHCANGLCVFESMLDCDDDNVCTTDACHPLTGCVHQLNSAPCDDGNVCTTGDHCHLGECISAGNLACNDNNPCTADTCDPASGCAFAPTDGICDDGNVCTVGDGCVGGLCVSTGVLGCDDGNLCTTDTCSPESGCSYKANSLPCNDGDLCTVEDLCVAGQCQGSAPLDCDDQNPCTDDSCDAQTGCVHVANALACDDGNACTTGDHCVAGDCLSAGMLLCDDGNICTNDNCDPGFGCVYSANSQPCDDGDACTVGDQCAAGECAGGGPLACPDDGNTCTAESCDSESGCVSTPLPDCCGNALVDAGESCDDGNQADGDGCSAQCALEVSTTLIPGNTDLVAENFGLRVRCVEWDGDTCTNAQVLVPAETCNAYDYKELWHINVYGNSSYERNCPNWCALATGGNTNWSVCNEGTGLVGGSYRACAMSTTTQCTSSVYTWMTDYAGQNGKLHLYLGNCYPSYEKLRIRCDGW